LNIIQAYRPEISLDIRNYSTSICDPIIAIDDVTRDRQGCIGGRTGKFGLCDDSNVRVIDANN